MVVRCVVSLRYGELMCRTTVPLPQQVTPGASDQFGRDLVPGGAVKGGRGKRPFRLPEPIRQRTALTSPLVLSTGAVMLDVVGDGRGGDGRAEAGVPRDQ
jgi:hypothetical protein